MRSEPSDPTPAPPDSIEARLDAAFASARATHDTAPKPHAPPWQHPGVIAPAFETPWKAPWPAKRTIITALSIAVPFALTIALVVYLGPNIRASMFTHPFLLALGIFTPAFVFTSLTTNRARAKGRAYAPLWALAVVVAYFLTILVLFVSGVLPTKYMSIVAGISIVAWFPLITPLRQRVGDELRCAACEYAYVYTDPAGPEAPDRCSECGARWHDRAGLVRGHKARPRAWLFAVAALFWAAAAFMPAVSGRLAFMATTGSLINAVTASRAGFTNDQWRELNTRTLNDAQRLRLARGLLDLRLTDQSLAADADAWLDAEATAGRLPQDLVDRYHREIFDARLIAPARVRTGTPVTIDLESSRRGYAFAPRDSYLAIAGWDSPQSPDQATGPESRPRRTVNAGSQSLWLGVQTANPNGARATFTFHQPGPARVRIIYWLIVTPKNTIPATITWNPDGSPATPPETYILERRELWVDLTVEP